MRNYTEGTIDAETIKAVGLKPTNTLLNAATALCARVYEYPSLEHVYVMDSDLYGHSLPKDSCFLAFDGRHGLMGKDLKVETLKHASVKEIEKIVQANNKG